MRVTLLHNPSAGGAGKPDGAELVRLARAAGHRVRYQSSVEPGWEAVLDEPADLVAVAGGDGTVGRAARALVGRGLPFTVLPVGTANNVSKTLGLTLGLGDEALAALVAGWARGRRVPFDVGLAEGPWGRRHFIEGFGVGLLAATMPEADRNPVLNHLPDGDARVAHGLGLLRERLDGSPALALSLVLDGRALSGEYVLLEAMNTQYVGPNLRLAPDCDLGDGKLDVLLVSPAERGRLRDYLGSWQEGTPWPADLPTHRGRRLELVWSGFPVHIDDAVWPRQGEPAPAPPARVSVSVDAAALDFLLPASPC